MVGLPVRQPATVEYSSSYTGRDLLLAWAAHALSTLDQSLIAPVAGSTGDPQGASSLSGKLLWAMPMMMASAPLSSLCRSGRLFIRPGRVRPVCSERFLV